MADIPDLTSCEGYTKLARFIAESSEYATFHGFTVLYAENLLYLQAEIVQLEKELRMIQDEDRSSSHEDRQNYHRDWGKLRASIGQAANEGEDGRQLAKIEELRGKLNEYYESLFRYEKILQLKRPHPTILKDRFSWMTRATAGNVYIISDDGKVFQDVNVKAMVTVENVSDEDLFTRWFKYAVLSIFHSLIGWNIFKAESDDHLQDTVVYQVERIERVTRALSVSLASLLPTASIYILFWVVDMKWRLGVISGLTLLFSFCLSFMTPAKTHDIFAATVAFTAILVVFVSSTGPTS